MNTITELQIISMDKIVIKKGFNARKNFDKTQLKELALSIDQEGLLQPVLVSPIEGTDTFQLIIGERRFRACKMLKLKEIPCTVSLLGEQAALTAMTIENLQREDLTPLEEADGIGRLLSSGIEYEEVANKLGKSLSFVRKRNRLNFLIKAWRAVLDYQGINYSCALELSRLSEEVQTSIKTRLDNLSYSYNTDENEQRFYNHNLIKNAIHDSMMDLSKVNWDLDDTELVKEAGACALCSKRSSCKPHLFEDMEDSADKCLDIDCFSEKLTRFIEVQIERAKTINKGVEPLLLSSSYYSDKDNVLGSGRYDHSKKSHENSVPGIMIDGAHQGKLVYVLRTSGFSSGPMTDEQKAERKKVIRQNKIDKLTRSLIVEQASDVFLKQLTGGDGFQSKDVENLLNYWITQIIGYGQSKDFIAYFSERYDWKEEVDYQDSSNRREIIRKNIETVPMPLKLKLLVDAHFKFKTVSDYDNSANELAQAMDGLNISIIKRKAAKIIDNPKKAKSSK